MGGKEGDEKAFYSLRAGKKPGYLFGSTSSYQFRPGTLEVRGSL